MGDQLQIWGPGPYDNEVAQLWLGADESLLTAVDIAMPVYEFTDLLNEGAVDANLLNFMALRLRASAQFLLDYEADPEAHRSPLDLIPIILQIFQVLYYSDWPEMQPDGDGVRESMGEQQRRLVELFQTHGPSTEELEA